MPLDFECIRNTMYKYSRAAVDVFMNGGAELTFIFAWFIKSQCARQFLMAQSAGSTIANFGSTMLTIAERDLLPVAL
jgi:hypothetical protein